MNEVKVVILVKDERSMVGVQSPDCDPIMTSIEGGLTAALERVPSLVEEAQQKWDADPRYPKAILPEEPKVEAQSTTRARQQAPAKPAQQAWF